MQFANVWWPRHIYAIPTIIESVPLCVQRSFTTSFRMSDYQMRWMIAKKVPNIYAMLEVFVQWIKDGMYDFHHLPFMMKADLSDSQKATIQSIPEDPHFRGNAMHLDILDTNKQQPLCLYICS